jgi:hypothetical protein
MKISKVYWSSIFSLFLMLHQHLKAAELKQAFIFFISDEGFTIPVAVDTV